jgi:hypothetical protein
LIAELILGHGFINVTMQSMNISTANMKSNFFLTACFLKPHQHSFYYLACFYFSYVIRMKEMERERRLDEKAAKQASHAE